MVAKKKKYEVKYHWRCCSADNRRGCFSADYEGHCTSRSKRGFKSKDDAKAAADRHSKSCRFKARSYGYGIGSERNDTHIWHERKLIKS